MRMSAGVKKFAIAILLLTVAVFSVGGGNREDRFLSSLGFTGGQRGAGSWYELENFTAVNLASEALEAFRAIRNTNLIKYAGRQGECWKMLPRAESAEQAAEADCADPNLIRPGYYAVNRLSGTGQWSLEFLGEDRPEDDARSLVSFIADGKENPSTVLARPENDTVFYRAVLVEFESPTVMSVTAEVSWWSGKDRNGIEQSTKLSSH